MRRAWDKFYGLTGFRGKTIWDLLGLLIVPVVIALAGWWLSEVSTRNQQQIETDRAQQSVLQSYIQDMTALLLDKGLATSKPDSLITQVARANTISAIYRLDSSRNRILLGFLSDSNLLSSGSVTLLSGADLSRADLRDADLSYADLENTNLRDADLSYTNLSYTNLSYADLSGAILSDTSLSPRLSYARLGGADLSDAVLSFANLSGANLTFADLSYADLENTNLSDAILEDTNLSDAYLWNAEGWTNEQLAQAESLIGATMPDGIKMTQKNWEEFKRRYRQ
jgi:hypothetical protein